MDWTAIIGMAFTGLLSIGAVALFLRNNMPKVEPWVALSKDAVETLADVSKALEPDADGKITLTPEEIAKLNTDVEIFKIQFNLAMGRK